MIQIDRRDGVTILELSHGKANALDLELCAGLTERLDELRDTSISALVMTGRRGIFSAGVDLLRLMEDGPEYVEKFLPAFRGMLETLFLFPKPVVAAVNGHAIAGGCVLACAADHRVMARDSGRVGIPELRVGVPFPSCALEIMRLTLAPRQFQELMYRGAALDPDAALERGLINEIAEPDDLLNQAVASAQDLASVPAAAFGLTKVEIRRPFFERMKAAREGHERAITDVWKNPETLSAIRSYVSRTFKRVDS